MVIENKRDNAYECNCHDVKVGMAINDAKEIMERGLDINCRKLDYEVSFNGTVPTDFYLAYSTNGGSYIAKIYYDKNTGRVTEVSCPPKRCE